VAPLNASIEQQLSALNVNKGKKQATIEEVKEEEESDDDISSSSSGSSSSGSSSSSSSDKDSSDDDGIVLHTLTGDQEDKNYDRTARGDYLRRYSHTDSSFYDRHSQQQKVTKTRHNKADRRCRYDIGIHSSIGKSVYHNTTVVTFLPRYVLVNNLNCLIEITQLSLTEEWRMSIPVTTSTGFHWPSKDRETKLMIRLCDSHASDGSVNSNPNTGSTTGSATERSSWNWSGEFSIDSLGEETLKIRSASNRTDVVLVRVSVRLVESTIIVNFEPSEIKVVPYRINNNTSHKIRFRQNTGNEDDRFDEMGPRESLPYSWDEPTKQRILQIEFQQGSKWVSKNYKLDVLALHHRVQLTRTLPDLSNPEFQGYLYRSHGNLLESKWVRSYCVLRKATLYIFRANQKAVKGNDGESNNTPEVRKMDLQGIIHLGPGKQFNLSSLASMDDLCSKVTVKQSKEREVGWSKKIGLALQDMAEAAIMGGGWTAR